MLKPFTLSLMTAAVCMLAPFAAQAQGKPPALPDGAGKELVSGVCTGCHQTNMITQSSGYTREGWKELIGTMIDLSGVPDQQAAITGYLAEHYSPKYNRQAAKIVSGPLQVRSPNGSCRRSANARAIQSRRRTARSGGLGNSAI